MSENQKKFVVNLNTFEISHRDIKKIEVLFDLDRNNYQIQDTLHDKCIACLNGFCTIADAQSNQSVVLNRPDMTVEVNKNINLEIQDFSKNSRIVVTYYKD